MIGLQWPFSCGGDDVLSFQWLCWMAVLDAGRHVHHHLRLGHPNQTHANVTSKLHHARDGSGIHALSTALTARRFDIQQDHAGPRSSVGPE